MPGASAGSTGRDLNDLKPLGFWLMPVIPWLGLIGHAVGIPGLSPLVILLVVPLLDFLIGIDETNGDGDAGAKGRVKWPDAFFDAVPWAYAASWIAALLSTGFVMTEPGLGTVKNLDLLVGAGAGSAFATCVAHEMLHRASSRFQWGARFMMAVVAYGGFVLEHLHHHAKCGQIEEGTVPRRGESLASFVVRNIAFSHRNGWRIGESLRIARGHGVWRNRVLQLHAASAAMLVMFCTAFGATGAVLFVFQALTAWASLEAVQYFEHYALQRREGERIGVEHSWNSNGWLTNAITLNITRHSHHHCDASVPYQQLRYLEGVPTFLMGYFGMVWLALIPAVWSRVYDRVAVEPKGSGEPWAVNGAGQER